VPTFRGELREERSGHHNERDRNEIVEIRKARCREVYDLGVADDPHLFSLASGVLTHNSKPNPMPESVTDRCTKAHEYVFLLTKSERYFYDAEAVKEVSTGRTDVGQIQGRIGKSGFVARPDAGERFTRNRRSVWTVATHPYSGAHFATFPPDLIKPMVLAGTSERGCCPKCGTPWERVVERISGVPNPSAADQRIQAAGGALNGGTQKSTIRSTIGQSRTTGWRPGCECGGEPVPCTVLDPFGGSGTTGEVAKNMFRKAVLIELNEQYLKLQTERMAQEILAL